MSNGRIPYPGTTTVPAHELNSSRATTHAAASAAAAGALHATNAEQTNVTVPDQADSRDPYPDEEVAETLAEGDEFEDVLSSSAGQDDDDAGASDDTGLESASGETLQQEQPQEEQPQEDEDEPPLTHTTREAVTVRDRPVVPSPSAAAVAAPTAPQPQTQPTSDEVGVPLSTQSSEPEPSVSRRRPSPGARMSATRAPSATAVRTVPAPSAPHAVPSLRAVVSGGTQPLPTPAAWPVREPTNTAPSTTPVTGASPIKQVQQARPTRPVPSTTVPAAGARASSVVGSAGPSVPPTGGPRPPPVHGGAATGGSSPATANATSPPRRAPHDMHGFVSAPSGSGSAAAASGSAAAASGSASAASGSPATAAGSRPLAAPGGIDDVPRTMAEFHVPPEREVSFRTMELISRMWHLPTAGIGYTSLLAKFVGTRHVFVAGVLRPMIRSALVQMESLTHRGPHDPSHMYVQVLKLAMMLDRLVVDQDKDGKTMLFWHFAFATDAKKYRLSLPATEQWVMHSKDTQRPFAVSPQNEARMVLSRKQDFTIQNRVRMTVNPANGTVKLVRGDVEVLTHKMALAVSGKTVYEPSTAVFRDYDTRLPILQVGEDGKPLIQVSPGERKERSYVPFVTRNWVELSVLKHTVRLPLPEVPSVHTPPAPMPPATIGPASTAYAGSKSVSSSTSVAPVRVPPTLNASPAPARTPGAVNRVPVPASLSRTDVHPPATYAQPPPPRVSEPSAASAHSVAAVPRMSPPHTTTRGPAAAHPLSSPVPSARPVAHVRPGAAVYSPEPNLL